MSPDPHIYHITHVENLPGIVREGGLWCDSKRISRGLASTNIGHRHIKNRRLLRRVDTPTGGTLGTLGDFVPFNFCSRSVMLFVVNKGHDDYTGGQESIVHLVSTVSQATALRRPWAFTDRHAELAHALYFDDLARLPEVPWHVMDERYWSAVKEERQAEFLVHDFFPMTSILAVVTMTPAIAVRAQMILKGVTNAPNVTTQRSWYY